MVNEHKHVFFLLSDCIFSKELEGGGLKAFIGDDFYKKAITLSELVVAPRFLRFGHVILNCRAGSRLPINCSKMWIIPWLFTINQGVIIRFELYADLLRNQPRWFKPIQRSFNTYWAHSLHCVNLRFFSLVFLCSSILCGFFYLWESNCFNSWDAWNRVQFSCFFQRILSWSR